MNKSFEENLDKLRTRIIRMGSLVEEQVEFAIRALRDGNAELARIVIERDDKVDKLDLKIDKQCQRIFALNQPVASDLRLLLTAIKINNELERIGDMAASIAHTVINRPETVSLSQLAGVERLASAVHTLLKASIDAFINNDPDLATHLLPVDSSIDSLSTETQSRLAALMQEDVSRVPAGALLLIAIHNLSRIADHATNIAENVIFLVEAKLVRHQNVGGDPMTIRDVLDASDDGSDDASDDTADDAADGSS
ncbi:MAG: phosphate signaling complex protein PhoU [Candidatus Kapaibacteriota bacterium]